MSFALSPYPAVSDPSASRRLPSRTRSTSTTTNTPIHIHTPFSVHSGACHVHLRPHQRALPFSPSLTALAPRAAPSSLTTPLQHSQQNRFAVVLPSVSEQRKKGNLKEKKKTELKVVGTLARTPSATSTYTHLLARVNSSPLPLHPTTGAAARTEKKKKDRCTKLKRFCIRHVRACAEARHTGASVILCVCVPRFSLFLCVCVHGLRIVSLAVPLPPSSPRKKRENLPPPVSLPCSPAPCAPLLPVLLSLASPSPA